MTRLTFLGTGTSQGVPMIGCGCEVCRSGDNRDKRLRASAFVEYGGLKILVDAGPDFRYQMLRAGISHLDAILLTHNHKDHTGGLDDVRAFNYLEGLPAEIYCEEYVEESLRKEYSYAFSEMKYPGAPEWHIHHIDEKPFTLHRNDGAGDRLVWISGKGYVHTGNMTTHTEDAISTGNRSGAVEVIPIRGMHYRLPVLGFRFGDIDGINLARAHFVVSFQHLVAAFNAPFLQKLLHVAARYAKLRRQAHVNPCARVLRRGGYNF